MYTRDGEKKKGALVHRHGPSMCSESRGLPGKPCSLNTKRGEGRGKTVYSAVKSLTSKVT